MTSADTQNENCLHVYWGKQRVGSLWSNADLDLSFAYSPDWLQRGRGPISLSLPLSEKKYEKLAHNFFANLLPEGDYRRSIERLFRVSADHDFALLEILGGDCAGALSIGTSVSMKKKATPTLSHALPWLVRNWT